MYSNYTGGLYSVYLMSTDIASNDKSTALQYHYSIGVNEKEVWAI